jgi:hypothetical protein
MEHIHFRQERKHPQIFQVPGTKNLENRNRQQEQNSRLFPIIHNKKEVTADSDILNELIFTCNKKYLDLILNLIVKSDS